MAMSYKKTPLYLYSKPDVILVVGDNEIEAHENVIAVYSDFFKAALTSGLKEAHSKRIEINEIEPQILDVVLDWLYRVPLTPLFNTDLNKQESLPLLLSKDVRAKVKALFRAFDFLQIKGAEGYYVRYLEEELRKLPCGNLTITISPDNSYEVVDALNEVYQCGYSITGESLDRLVGAVYSSRTSAQLPHRHDATMYEFNSGYKHEALRAKLGPTSLERFKSGLKALEDPNPSFLRDISISLTNRLLAARDK
ncbi:hypothetical protein TWF481_012079 [Arthrobotrys musiformis]|uniref:BTB domain-containing protein n=1 Tax=Arthrobotrys musiformis TaxID=47236 RepID=A0AAV9VW51_9PEZI